MAHPPPRHPLPAQQLSAWHEAAARGDAAAMSRLGVAHEFGDGTPRHPQTAFAWYLRAAQAGHPDAMTEVADRLEAGNGAPADPAQAAQRRAKAASQAAPSAAPAPVRPNAPRT